MNIIFCEKDNALRGMSSSGWFMLGAGVEGLLKHLAYESDKKWTLIYFLQSSALWQGAHGIHMVQCCDLYQILRLYKERHPGFYVLVFNHIGSSYDKREKKECILLNLRRNESSSWKNEDGRSTYQVCLTESKKDTWRLNYCFTNLDFTFSASVNALCKVHTGVSLRVLNAPLEVQLREINLVKLDWVLRK